MGPQDDMSDSFNVWSKLKQKLAIYQCYSCAKIARASQITEGWGVPCAKNQKRSWETKKSRDGYSKANSRGKSANTKESKLATLVIKNARLQCAGVDVEIGWLIELLCYIISISIKLMQRVHTETLTCYEHQAMTSWMRINTFTFCE